MPRLLAALLLAVLALPAAAQEHEVARRSYAFFAPELAIEVTAEGPGALQVLRGRHRTVEVAAHAADGLASFALAGHRGERLQLSALGHGEAAYIVVVPQHVRVHVLLPGEQRGRYVADGAPLRWTAQGDVIASYSPEAPAGFVLPTGPEGLFRIHRADAPPRALLLDQYAVRSLVVRIEGEHFEVASSEPLTFSPGAGADMSLRRGDRAVDLLISVPAATRSFQLQTGGEVLLAVRDGRAVSPCARTVRIRLDDGERIEFFPAAGRLTCR